MTVKDQKDITDFSTTYSDYFINVCDSTYLLFEGLVPMTEKIPFKGYK